MAAVPHPWRRLGSEFPDVPVLRVTMPSRHLHAETRWSGRRPVAVILHRDLTQVQARCAIAHECEHLARGAPCGTLRARIERLVVVATARYLLPDLEVVAAAMGGHDLRRAAEELWVTHAVLLDRLGSLTVREHRMLATLCERSPDGT